MAAPAWGGRTANNVPTAPHTATDTVCPMGIARMVFYLLGGLLMIIGLGMLFFATGLDAWIPGSIVVAGLIIILGLLVMGMSDRTPETDHTHTREVHHHDDDRYH